MLQMDRAAVTGLAISKALEVTQIIANIIQQFTAAEVALVSIERLSTFVDLPPEAPTASRFVVWMFTMEILICMRMHGI